jgi:hypothetical protein
VNKIKAELIIIIAHIAGVAHSLVAALMPVLEADLSTLLTEILPIAEQVVIGLATHSMSGKEKQQAAFAQITQMATAAGIQATTQAVNIAIELAVANLPKTAAVPAPAQAQSGIVVPDQAAS